VIPFRNVTVPHAREVKFNSTLLSPFIPTFLPLHYLKMSSQDQDQQSTRRRVQPPTRYPDVEFPRPADASDTPTPAETPPTRAQTREVTSLPPYLPRVSTFPSTGTTPHDEGTSAPIARRTVATSEEVTLAHVRELDHALNEALHRLEEADQRISLMEAELTHFRDTEFSPLKTRVAAMESLNTHSRVTRDTQAGCPKKEVLSYENLPRESVDPKVRRGKSRPGKRDTSNQEYEEHSVSSSSPDDGSSSEE
jgi:hypothetical protein